MLRRFLHNLTVSRFKKQQLNIIENIPAETFSQILDTYVSKGWEVSHSYGAFSAENNKWDAQLRKGTSELQLRWKKAHQGSLFGPDRIVRGVAEEFSQEALAVPTLM